MSLDKRLTKLEEAIPEAVRRENAARVPTENLAAFVGGLMRREFALGDIDRTNFDQMNMLSQYGACLVALGPRHQAWCDASGWGRVSHDEWERATLADLTPIELAWLKALAAICHPAEGEPSR